MFGSLKKRLKDVVKKVSAIATKAEVPEAKKIEEKPIDEEVHEEIEEKIEKLEEIKEKIEEEKLPPEIIESRIEEKKAFEEEKLVEEEVEREERERVAEERKEIEQEIEKPKPIEEIEKELEEGLKELEGPKPRAIETIEKKKEGKGLFPKIFKKVVEKKLSESDIEKILKELQIALLENDTALEVAERICDDVKNDLLDKSVKRGQTEDIIKHALKNAMLDVMSQERIDIRELIENSAGPFTIILLGFNGTGKCVSGDTLISMTNGEISSVKNLYEKYKHLNKEIAVENGFLIENPSIELFSVNPFTLRIERVKAQNIWKLRKEKLLKISLKNGQNIKVTPEHPFFVLKPGKIIQKRADEISSEDYVMVPKIITPKNDSLSKLKLMEKISNRKLFVNSEFLVDKAYKTMEKVFGSLENAFNELVSEADWATFRYFWKNKKMLPSPIILKLAKVNSDFAYAVENEKITIKFGRSRTIKLPDISPDFYCWLGLFYAEGHLNQKYIDFTNSEDWLLETFSRLTKKTFGLNKICIRPDSRNTNVKRLICANRTLSYFVEKALGIPRYKKSSGMELPGWVTQCSDNLIAEFLRSYWECDGYIDPNQRVLEAATASEKFARHLSLLLLRFGIIASISTKFVNEKPYYRIFVVGKEKMRIFHERIGFLGFRKQKRLENVISINSQFEKTELIPMQADYLRNLRLSMNVLQQDLAGILGIGTSLLSQYERTSYQTSIPAEMIAKLAVNLSSPFLEMLACADVRWVKVSEIEEVHDQEEWVFDFTVPGYHNFVANNFIVHNTTTLAKLARMLKEFEPVIAAADTFRAASIEQLEEHSRRLGFEIVKHKYGADSAAVIFDAKKHAAASGSKLVLADTAGRSHANVNLMDELKKVCRVNKPDMKILVLDALTGNDIYDQAKLFNDAVGVDAIILTKTDVYEKGGAALSAAYTIKKPILYLGTGQNYEDLKEFSPEAIANMLLE